MTRFEGVRRDHPQCKECGPASVDAPIHTNTINDRHPRTAVFIGARYMSPVTRSEPQSAGGTGMPPINVLLHHHIDSLPTLFG
jgi:hypothetical protein